MHNKIKKKIINEIKNWTFFEFFLMISSITIIISLGIYNSNSLVTLIAGITGILGVMLGAKGKISCFVVASINSICYIIISFNKSGGMLISSVILHLAFYIPMNVIGFIMWFKNRNNEGDVLVQSLSSKGIILGLIILFLFYITYTLILKYTAIELLSNLWLDSFIFVTTIAAIILNIYRFIQQWALWILSNIISLILWIIILIKGQNNSASITMIIMFITYLVSCIYGFWHWWKLESKNPRLYFQQCSIDEYQKKSIYKKIIYKLSRFYIKN